MNTATLRCLGALLLAALLSACGAQQATLDSLTIGFSTPRGNKIWIRDAEFDRTWAVPGGIITCCWNEAGGLSSLFHQPMPSSMRVRWGDVSRGVIYEAQTDLPDDLTRTALALPKFQWKGDGLRDRGYYLIVGLRDNGSVVVWLSNAPHGRNIRGRVLKVVARAEGRVVGKIRSE